MLDIIFYLSIVLTLALFLVSLFSHSYKYPTLIYILSSPIVYASWSRRYGDISLIHLFNVGFIFILIIKFLIKQEQLYEFPYLKLFLFYFFLNLVVAIHIYFNSNWFSALDFFIKSVFMPLALYLFYKYFGNHSDGRRLITVLIAAGIFPLVFILIQKVSGHVWFYRQTRGIVRNIGLYHDAVTPRIFLMQILIGIFIYWHYFLKNKKNMSVKLILISLFLLTGLGLYYLYSKAIFLTLLVWIIMFVLLRRKLVVTSAVAIFALLFVILLSGGRVESEINQVFSKEVDYVSGNLSSDYIFSGRGGIWKMYITRWKNLSVIDKFLGAGVSHGYFHNDFLRILFSGGFLLLGTYVFVLVLLSAKVVKDFVFQNQFISFVALLSISYLLIESMGQLSNLYPHLQIFVWGLIGLSINRNLRWENENSRRKKIIRKNFS